MVSLNKALLNPYFWGGTLGGGRLTSHDLSSELQISQQQTRRGVMNHYIPRSLTARPPKNGLVGRRSFPFRDSGNFSGASGYVKLPGGGGYLKFHRTILNLINQFRMGKLKNRIG